MHQIHYQRKCKNLFISIKLTESFFFQSGILHFVKDNYFRTSSSSSEDEYDSDDSARKDNNPIANTTAGNTQNKSGTLINTTVVATSASIQPSINDGKR
jgi:hypothetical protein